MIIGLVILATARFFVPFSVMHPIEMVIFLALTCVSFCLFGFILGVLADGFEKLQIVPMLILTPLTFLGGTFYSLHMLPPLWQTITRFNPIVYLISGFRWAFYGIADIDIGVSMMVITAFLAVCLSIVYWIFSTGYKLKN
jgi:ABC-2 type transport system permease protein